MTRFDDVDLSAREAIERNTRRLQAQQREPFAAGYIACWTRRCSTIFDPNTDEIEAEFQEWLKSLEDT